MNFRDEPELVKKSFAYLFDEYGFKVLESRIDERYHFWVVVLISTKCRIKISNDRESVTLSISPLWDPPGWQAGPWSGLSIVIAYLNNGVFTWDYDMTGTAEAQLERLSDVLQSYIDQILTLFGSETFSEHQPELERLYYKRYSRFWE